MRNANRRLPAMLRPKAWRFAVPWIQAGDYERMQEILGFPKELPFDYDRWRSKTETRERELKLSGKFFVVRVIVYPDKFLRYCEDEGQVPTMKMLDHFAYSHLHPGAKR